MAGARHRPRGFSSSASSERWEIGLVSLPAVVPGEDGKPIQPVVALVMEANGALRGSAAGHPDRPLEALEPAIAMAIQHPQPPCVAGEPRQVVVNDAQLLELVPPLLPGALVSKGATPQVVEAANSLREHMAGGEEARGLAGVTSYLTADVTPDVVKDFFAVAAALYDRRPWERLAGDGQLFQVTCGPLGIRGWAGCVIGQNRESYGVLLFDSVATYAHYVDLAERLDQGEAEAIREYPPHRAINYEPKSAMPKALLREIQHHRWPVAGGDAFPTIMLVEQDLVLAPPCRADYRQLETVALALCEWLDTEPDLARQWNQPTGRRRRFQVAVGGKTLPVTIGVIPPPAASVRHPVAEVAPELSAHVLEALGNPPPQSLKVPATLRERVDSLLARIDPFCSEHLNNDYRALIHAALAALARKRPSPLLTGREPSWCAGVVHAIGAANFLFDPSQTPHCTPRTIYEHFGVAASTGQNHSKKVADLLDIHHFEPRWTLPSLLEESPIPWMVEVDGFIQDVRTLPLEIQIEACAKGLIPYVPALRDQARETGSGDNPAR